MPTVGGRAPRWPLGTQWLALCQAGRRRQWQGEPEPSPAGPGPPRAPRALGPSQWPFLGVRRDGSVSVAPHPRGEGSGFLYRGAFEPLSAFKGRKRSEANGVFCFQTDLDFVKNPSGAAVLMAGVSGVSGSTAADPPTHLPPGSGWARQANGPTGAHPLCAPTVCRHCVPGPGRSLAPGAAPSLELRVSEGHSISLHQGSGLCLSGAVPCTLPWDTDDSPWGWRGAETGQARALATASCGPRDPLSGSHAWVGVGDERRPRGRAPGGAGAWGRSRGTGAWPARLWAPGSRHQPQNPRVATH